MGQILDRATGTFPPESAARAMTPENFVLTVRPDTTIGDVEKTLFEKTRDVESIDYVYVVDAARKLEGVVSVKEVFRKEKFVRVSDIMKRDVVAVRPHTDQERAAHLALKHNIKAVPVVDKENIFLGVLLSDAILRILYTETSEDLLRLAGIKRAESAFDNVLKIPITTSLIHRLPWLLLGTAGGIFIAQIIDGFRQTLEQNLILAAFIPLVVYIADAVGTQMEAFIVRDLAINSAFNFFRYLGRQILIIFLLGLILGCVLLGVSIVLYQNFQIGIVLAISLLVSVLSSVVTGLLIPYLFWKLRMDPANASGPIATIIQDAVSVGIYFSIASRFL